MDELKTMRTFVKVVDEGSFAGAARALNVANSVVTRAVGELEESLKCRLLNRTTRALLSLTDVGAQYLQPDFVARLLAHADVVLCATPEYLARHAPIVNPQDVDMHTMLVPDLALERKVWSLHSVREDGSRESVSLRPQRAFISSPNPEVMIAAARRHCGIAGALSLNVSDDLRAGTLQRFLPGWSAASFRIYAAMPSRSHLPRRPGLRRLSGRAVRGSAF